jgi:hypothetical protein
LFEVVDNAKKKTAREQKNQFRVENGTVTGMVLAWKTLWAEN